MFLHNTLKLSPMESIICHQCGKEIVRDPNSCGTGYAVMRRESENEVKICYDCCAVNDEKFLLENGYLHGYFHKDKNGKCWFTNWPGTFKIWVYSHKKGNHNFAGRNGRTDFWLNFKNNHYWGVNIGDNECAKIKLIKS
jgi:hypothetical protein